MPETTIVKQIKRLYQDCGWKNESSYRCNICEIRATTQKGPNDDYTVARPLIIEHIITNHPEYCFQCKHECGELFCAKKDKKKHEVKKNKLCKKNM